MKIDLEILGTTKGGWVIRRPPSMTNRAEYAYLIEKGSQKSILEKGKGHWRYMLKFDTSMLHPNQSRDTDLLSIKAIGGVKTSKQLQDALMGLNMSKEDADEAIGIIDKIRS